MNMNQSSNLRLAGDCFRSRRSARSPSDAMAIGLRFDAKIFVRQKVFRLERENLERQEPIKERDKPDTLTI
ncbi:MAG: hypothetical protein EXQ56_08745 [Acidobacteria bacterium]|nr:hypothetical protein [Acidobacteriota bacterium]